MLVARGAPVSGVLLSMLHPARALPRFPELWNDSFPWRRGDNDEPPYLRQARRRSCGAGRVASPASRAALFMDLSLSWGEMPRRTMCWVQPPGTPTVGHSMLDAYYATGDESLYRAAERTGLALVAAPTPAGGWNYVHDSMARRPCVSGTTPSAPTAGGSRSSSTTTATPPSTTPAPRRPTNCSSGSTWSAVTAGSERPWTARSAAASTRGEASADGVTIVRLRR
jgi:hypothetical protein